VITKVVLYYGGQCSSANATVGVGAGRQMTIVLLYRQQGIEEGKVEVNKERKKNDTKTIASYTTLVQ
jgi:hypothetical protein